jgi:hypothetical protein
MATLVPGEKARMYALGGIMRGGASRGGYVDSRVYINIDGGHIGWGGIVPDVGVLIGSLTITDTLDETPNTCNFRINGSGLNVGAHVVITQGSKNRPGRTFAGYALTVQQIYAGIPKNVQADVRCVDYTWLLGMKKVTGQYRNESATQIVKDLVQKFAAVNLFTYAAVEPNLPILDQITFTDEALPEAITRVCRRIGAYWYVDYDKDVHVFFEDTRRSAPVPLTPTHTSLTNFSKLDEQTQVLTRVYVEGRGSSLLAGVPAGATMLPVEAVDMFTADADVFLKVSKSGADSTLHLNFTGVVPGGGGSLVGPGAAPSSAPTLAAAAGGAIETGPHDYAYTWVTAAGETKPSPIATIVLGTVSAGTVLPVFVQQDSPPVDPNITGAWRPGDLVEWAYSYATRPNGDLWVDGTSTPLSPPVSAVAQLSVYHMSGSTPGTNAKSFEIAFPYSTNPAVKYIDVYHRVNGGAWRRWLSPVLTNDSTDYGYQAWKPSYTFYLPYNSSAWTPPSVAPVVRSVAVAAIAVGPATVTARKLYRSPAYVPGNLHLVDTLANNTATTYTDTKIDGQLGVAAPAGDTSGLQQPNGIVYPGAPTMIVASTGPFNATGGLALVGEQAIRYTSTGYSAQGGMLAGIPASGYGAITGPISYNTAIRAAPLLTGIPASGTRSLGVALNAGDEVYAVVQVDDTARRDQLATVLGIPEGIREEWIQDRRLSIAEARARGQATLASRPLAETTVEYTCRDQNTTAGMTVHVDLPAPTNVAGDFKIQQVTWSNFRPRPEQPPTARVTASSRRFSFEDLLRIVKTKE